jgi:hypothetical protein
LSKVQTGKIVNLADLGAKEGPLPAWALASLQDPRLKKINFTLDGFAGGVLAWAHHFVRKPKMESGEHQSLRSAEIVGLIQQIETHIQYSKIANDKVGFDGVGDPDGLFSF